MDFLFFSYKRPCTVNFGIREILHTDSQAINFWFPFFRAKSYSGKSAKLVLNDRRKV